MVVVVADLQKTHRGLRDRQQTAFERRYRHRRGGMDVNDTGDIGPRLVNGAMNNEAGAVYPIVELAEIGATQDIAAVIDLDQTRRGDLFVQHAVRVDQKSVRLSVDAR